MISRQLENKIPGARAGLGSKRALKYRHTRLLKLLNLRLEVRNVALKRDARIEEPSYHTVT